MQQNAALVIRFDVESAAALVGPVERSELRWPAWLEESLAALAAIRSVLDAADAPGSFYVVGELLERAGTRYAAVLGNRPGFHIGNHTFTHMKILRGEGPQPVERFDRELRATDALIGEHFGTGPTAFTAPGCFPNGLSGHPELLQVLWDAGHRSISTAGGPVRLEHGLGPAPIANPFWYADDGFPDLLEQPLSGWHCNLLFNTGGQNDGRLPAPGFPNGDILERLPRTPEEGFAVRLRELEHAAANGLIYAPTMHPWSVYRFDPELIHIRRLIDAARERDLPVLNCEQVDALLRDAR